MAAGRIAIAPYVKGARTIHLALAGPFGRVSCSNQPHSLQARMPALADEMWSCTEMPSGAEMSMIALVIWMSACDGRRVAVRTVVHQRDWSPGNHAA